MADDIRDLIAVKVRERVGEIILNGAEADAVADALLEVLRTEGLCIVDAEELWASEQRGTQYAEKLREAEERIALLDARHQPKTIDRWTPCEDHRGSPRLWQEQCGMCAKRPVKMCSCGHWPCFDHLALHGESEETCVHTA